MSTSSTESKDSESASSDDLCFCGHKRSEHFEVGPLRDYTGCFAKLNDQGQQDNCTEFRLAPPLGGQTVSEGPEQGEVCVGRGRPEWRAGLRSHRPVVRGEEGRCFICEPITVDEAIDMAEAADAVTAWGEENQPEPIDVDEAAREECQESRDRPQLSSVIMYAVDGGQQYKLVLGPGSHAIAEDGVITISHDRPVLGIVSVWLKEES